ncbi:MAG: hypothetical protein R3338_07375, partial [Thermoanaerobaculia bacterium]|nr:hypothetical protein [Thermoanaerobaculia bacterium]
VTSQIDAKMADLKAGIETAMLESMKSQLNQGNTLDFDGTAVTSADQITALHILTSHGRQAVDVDLATGEHLSHITMDSINVVSPGGIETEFFAAVDPNLAKAGWNYHMIYYDGSHGIHNVAFVNAALDVTNFAVENVDVTGTDGAAPNAGGGPGTGEGAVACASPFVYWVEIAGHIPGDAGSEWRTDVVTRNLSGDDADLMFYLHEANQMLQGTGMVTGGGQMVFEDLIALMGGTSNLGALEICSDEPLLVLARIFNQAEEGTFGQSFDGHVADFGYDAGETVSLIGMRQQTDLYRTNLSVTNGGQTGAVVSITLHDADGTELHTYQLEVAPGQVLQDTSPFASRANAPDVGWGYATVTIIEGANVQASASMVDMRTNDPTTIPAKQ